MGSGFPYCGYFTEGNRGQRTDDGGRRAEGGGERSKVKGERVFTEDHRGRRVSWGTLFHNSVIIMAPMENWIASTFAILNQDGI